MAVIEVPFLSKEDVNQVDLGLQDLVDAVEAGLRAHGEKGVAMPSEVHFSHHGRPPRLRKGEVQGIGTRPPYYRIRVLSSGPAQGIDT